MRRPISVIVLLLATASVVAAQDISQRDSTQGEVRASIKHPTDSKESEYVEFNPEPVVLLTRGEIESLIRRLDSDPLLADAVARLTRDADQALAVPPRAQRVIVYEGHVSNHPLRQQSARCLQDMNRLSTLTWSWLLTGNLRHRDQAKLILLSWVDLYEPTGNDVNENKLINCFVAFHHLRDCLTVQQAQAVESWLVAIVEAQMRGWSDRAAGSNRGAKRVKIVLLGAHTLGKPQWAEWGMKRAELCLEDALLADGRSRDLIHRDSMHYHVGSIENLVKIALMGRVMDFDLYTRTTNRGGSISKSIAFVRPYAAGEKVYHEWVNSKVELDRKRWQSGDPYYRPGKPWRPDEAYDLFRLAAVIDPALSPIADQLMDKFAIKDSWLAVVCRFLASDAQVRRGNEK